VKPMTRRTFLAAAALAAAGGGGLLYRRSTGDFDPDLEQTAELARLFDELGPARRVGRAYLESQPAEADEHTLVRLLEAEPGWRGVWEGSPARIAELARRTVRLDYGRGRTVRVDGWTLSRTEARLCALMTFG
jgi:hypothetical protein